jgi:IS605 OrfB family transposase
VCDMPEPEAVQTGLAVGLDANVRCVALSCNKFFNLRPLVHRKQEHRKGKGKPNLRNYTRDFLWKLSQAAVDFLSQQGAEVLRLENLTGLRKNRTEKHGSERERELRFILNNCYPYALLQWMLECRCVQAGIRVQYVDPRNTSKRCSRCGSLRTARPSQSRFVCGDCVWQLNAELNGARNIARGNAWGDGERIDIPHGAQNPLPVEVDAVHEIQPQESAGFFRLQADPPRGGNPCGVSIAL